MQIPVEVWDGEKWRIEYRDFNTTNDFGINEHDLDTELCRMGQLLVEYGDTWTDLKAQAARYKEDMDACYASKALAYRSSSEKMTENKIKEKITADDEYRQYVKRTNLAYGLANKMEVHYKSLLRKSDCLTALAYKNRKEIQSYGR